MLRQQILVWTMAPVLLFGVGACRRNSIPAGQTAIDLIDEFAYSDGGQSFANPDGAAAGSGGRLVDGWSERWRLPSGESVFEARQMRGTVRFDVDAPVARRLIVRCRRNSGERDGDASHRRNRARLMHAPRSGRQAQQEVVARLNRRWLGSFTPSDEFRDFVIELPPEAQRSGENLLELSQRGAPHLSHLRGLDSATVAFRSIRFERVDGVLDVPQLSTEQNARALLLPAATHIDYFLKIPPDAHLNFANRWLGGGSGNLTVEVQREGESPRRVWREATAGPANIDLQEYGNQFVKLSLAAEGGTARIDQPRIAATLSAATPSREHIATPLSASGKLPNIVLYVIDTLRADHLGCYGYQLPTSPRIDALAHESIRFSGAIAQSSWTKPSTASILTGADVFVHGALTLKDRIRDAVPTVAEMLHRRGYETAAFVTNVNVSEPFGFRRGFEHFEYLAEDEARASMHVLSDELNAHVLPWLEAPHAKPIFLYVHATDPHTPYTPPPGLAEKFRSPDLATTLLAEASPLQRMLNQPALVTPANLQYLQSLYDAEIASVDAQFGKLLDSLTRLQLDDDTLILLTADHGEEFHEHGGFEHGRTLYRELLSIPLVLRLPHRQRAGTTVTRRVRHVDIAPTLLEFAVIPVPASLTGVSLLHDGGRAPSAELFAHTSLPARAEVEALLSGSLKVIRRKAPRTDSIEVYDLAADPAEQHDLAPQRPIASGYGRERLLRWKLESHLSAPTAVLAATPAIDATTAERLRMLGYAP